LARSDSVRRPFALLFFGLISLTLVLYMFVAVYSRFQSVLTIQAMGSAVLGVLGSEAKALSVLWLQELVDDEERSIRIPVLKSKNLKQLRQNVRALLVLAKVPPLTTSMQLLQYINDFTKETHDYEIVRLRLTFTCWLFESLTRHLCLY
jgi:hypothetical protein